MVSETTSAITLAGIAAVEWGGGSTVRGDRACVGVCGCVWYEPTVVVSAAAQGFSLAED